MKTTLQKTWLLATLLLIGGISATAQTSEYCNTKVHAGTSIYFTWITNASGAVEITIAGEPGVTATFRDNTAMTLTGFKYDGKALSDYFNMSNPNGLSILILTPKTGIVPEAGKKITFNNSEGNGNFKWTLDGKTGSSRDFSFEYTYGTGCGTVTQLTAPTLSVATDGTVTFTPDANAASYMAYVYQDGAEVHSQTIANGGVLNYTAYLAGTYTVKLKAVAAAGSGYADSELSEAATWVPAVQSLGTSEYCNTPKTHNGVNIYFTWITNASGAVEITVTGDPGNTILFRGNNGLNTNGFRYDGVALSTNFNKSNPNGLSTLVLTPKPGFTPEAGKKITFSAANGNGNFEWSQIVGGVSSAPSNNTFTFEYTYGTDCGVVAPLTTPVPVVAPDGTITFTQDANAREYTAYVLVDGVELLTQVVTSGSKLNFSAYQSAVYTVKLKAVATPGTGWADAVSAPATWNPTIQTLGLSEYCNVKVRDTYPIYFTWTTNALGAIEISIAGEPGGTAVTFRGAQGMNMDGFRYYDKPLKDYFDKSNPNELSTLVLTPRSGVTILQGAKITFSHANGNGNFEWSPSLPSVGNNNNGFVFEYTYGTNCGTITELPAPTPSVATDGTITFTPDANAASYIAYVYQDGTEVHSQTIANGGKLNYTAYIEAEYTVKLKAFAAAGSSYADSELSTAATWNLIVASLGASEYCNMQGRAGTDIYFTWITDGEGKIIITITGNPGSAVSFRGGGLNMNGFKCNGQPMGNYFNNSSWTGSVETLTPKTTIPVGAKITFNKFSENSNFEWLLNGNNGSSSQFSFEYTYGTDCSSMELLDTPVVTAVAQDGTVTFSAVANAMTYMAYVYHNDTEIHSQVIASGDVLNFNAYDNAATYTVKVQAFATPGTNYADSELSAAASWSPVIAVLGNSEYCDNLLISGARQVYISWETNATGDIVVTISDVNEGDGAAFRGDGLQVWATTIKVNGKNAENYFTKDHTTDSKVFTLKKKDEVTIPVGSKITATNLYIAWQTSTGTTGGNQNIEYTYGTDCNQLLTSINAVLEKTTIFYPNPVKDVLYFTAQMEQISIYTLQGQLISSYQNAEKINMSGYAKGMYILQATDKLGNKISDKIEIR